MYLNLNIETIIFQSFLSNHGKAFHSFFHIDHGLVRN